MTPAKVSAIGSSIMSALIAWAMGRMTGLPTIILIVVVLGSAIGGAWFGYRSQQHKEQ